MQAGDRGFTDVLTRSFPSAKEFEVQRDEAFRRFTELIDRAKQTGGLREDFVAEDLPMLLMANAGVVAATTGSAPETSPRLVAYLLQAFAAQAAEPLPEPPAAAQRVPSPPPPGQQGPGTSLSHRLHRSADVSPRSGLTSVPGRHSPADPRTHAIGVKSGVTLTITVESCPARRRRLSVGHHALPRKISMPIRARLSELTLGRNEID